MKKLLSLIMSILMLIMALNVQVFAKGTTPELEYYFDYAPYKTATMTVGSKRIDKDKIIVVKGDIFDIKVYTNNGKFTESRWMVDKPGIISIYTTAPDEPNAAITALGVGEVTLTVKSRTTPAQASIKIQVLAEDPEQEKTSSYTFARSGYSHEYSKGIVGVHIPQNPASDSVDKFVEEIGMKSYRTSTRFVTGTDSYAEPYYKLAKKYNIPAVFNFYAFFAKELTDEEAAQEVRRICQDIKKNYEGPYHIELLNEVYNINYKVRYPTIDSYVDFCKVIAPVIREVLPDAVIMACGYQPGESNKLSETGETWFEPAGAEEVIDQAYRIAHWDDKVKVLVAEGYVDAITVHPYQPAGTHLTGQNQKSFMRAKFAAADGSMWDALWGSVFYYGARMYLTEWGQLQPNVYFGLANDAAEKARYLVQKYPSAALFNLKTIFGFISTGVVEQAHVHSIFGADGLGIMESIDDPNDTPQTIVFKEAAKIVEETDHFYELVSPDMDYVTIMYPWAEGNNAMHIENVMAWGVGDKDKMTQAAFLNQTDVPQKVTLKGTKIKPTWSYGGPADKLLPDFLHNKSYNHYPWTAIKDVANYKDYIFPADTHKGAEFVDEIEIPPYTMMIVDVQDEADIMKSATTTVSRVSAYNFRNSVILSVGTAKSYVNNVEKQIDENNADVTPIIENDRTLLPLRFVAESFGCDVKYNEKTRDIIITNRFDTQKIVFTVDKTTYTVDGEEKTLDVAPMIKNDRTLLPIRALAESLGKEVRWDPRGYIFIGNYAPRIDENLEYYFAEIEKLYK